jgi:acyl carrier protein
VEEFFEKLERTLEIEEGTLTRDTELSDISWDSLSALTFLIMLQEDYGMEAKSDDISDLKTVGELFERFIAPLKGKQ